MRITVVLPQAEHLDTAGVRIRYRRLEPALRRLGHRLDLRLIDEFAADAPLDADAYLFCKCQDARAAILARRIALSGRLVGLDVFDDYVSQREDSRLVHLRRWWEEMRPWLGFLLCATPAMAERLDSLAPGVAVHVVHDPFEAYDPVAIADRIEAKVARARASGVLEVAWFGMGDNPIFPVGVDDLSAFGLDLGGLRSTGLVPRLTVLTNRRAMTPERMEKLARLPIPAEIGEWTAEREARLLEDSLLCVLPVNAQTFSTVKSLNRAVSALTSGTQVLSLGHPLYEALGAFVYRSARKFLRDLGEDRLRLRRATLPALAALLSESGAPEAEAGRLAGFLAGLRAGRPVATAETGAVLHGTVASRLVHDFARAQGWLSVASPFAAESLDFDVRFETGADGMLFAVLSERALGRLGPGDRERVGSRPGADGQVRHVLPLDGKPLPRPVSGTLVERIVLYPLIMAEVRRWLGRLFPGVPVLLSELASPYAEAA